MTIRTLRTILPWCAVIILALLLTVWAPADAILRVAGGIFIIILLILCIIWAIMRITTWVAETRVMRFVKKHAYPSKRRDRL